MTMHQKKWLWLAVRNEVRPFLLTLLLSFLAAGCSCALIFTSGYLIAKSAMKPENILMVYLPIVLVRAFGIGKAVARYVERYVGHHFVLKILAKMRLYFYRILEPQALMIRSRYQTGDLLSTLADDIEHLQNFYLRTIFPVLLAFGVFAIYIVSLGVFDISFAGFMAFNLWILLFVFPGVSLWITYRKQRRIKYWRNGLYQKLTDAIFGLHDWMISGHRSAFIQAYLAEESKVSQTRRSLHRFQQFRIFLAQCLIGGMILSTAYWTGQQWIDGKISSPMIVAGVLVLLPLMDFFLPVSEAIEKFPEYQDSMRRLHQFQPQDQERPANCSHHVTKESFMDRPFLELKDVCYRYDSSNPRSIEKISLEIPYGKKMAILGRSGAGKSTLRKLIRGDVVPEQGRVTINGLEVHHLGDEISQIISVCEQRPYLFDTTVANNLRLGNPNASDEALQQVIKQVKLDQLLASLPFGVQTPMLEMGARFSGGERQRIALARILLQNSPIVVLDEPTVGLDPITEQELLDTIFQVFQEKTLIWITHHLTGVEQVDEVIFLDKGQVTMKGSHDELMVKEPRYQRLYHLDHPMYTH